MASIEPTKVDPVSGKPARGTRWRARYRDASNRSRSTTFDRKVEAERFLATMTTDTERGTWVDPRLGRITLTRWATKFLAASHDLRPTTRETYERDLKRFVLPRFGATPLARITAVEVRSWLADELEAGIAPSSVHRHYRTLRRVLQVAVESDLLAKNPCAAVKPPRIPPTEMHFLTAAQVTQLAEAMTEHWQPLVYTAAYAGLRWSELVGLKAKRVDLLHRKIIVAEQHIRLKNGDWVWQEPKTRAGTRTVSIPRFLAELLDIHLNERSVPGPDGLVFPNTVGKALVESSFLTNVWKPALGKAGIDHIRFHDLRHTAVALAIAQGAHPKAIQSRMGHSSITMTLDRYGHLFPELDEAIADGLDDTFEASVRARKMHSVHGSCTESGSNAAKRGQRRSAKKVLSPAQTLEAAPGIEPGYGALQAPA